MPADSQAAPGMRLSAVLTGLFPESVENAAEAVRGINESVRLGYHAVEFYYDGPGNAEIGRVCRDAGIPKIYHPAFALKKRKLDLGDPDKGRRRAAVDGVKRWIDLARGFGCEAVMLLSGPERSTPAEREEAFGRLAESLDEICGFASSGGGSDRVSVSMESFNSAGEPWLLIGSPDRCDRLARQVSPLRDNFGLTMDLSHLLQMGEEPVRALTAVKPWCGHLHLANCVIRDRGHPLYGDKHPPFGLEGGEVDEQWLTAFLTRLCQAGFFDRGQGSPVLFGAEVIARPPRDEPVETARRAKAVIERAWKAALMGR